METSGKRSAAQRKQIGKAGVSASTIHQLQVHKLAHSWVVTSNGTRTDFSSRQPAPSRFPMPKRTHQ
eukprot:900685-Pelagomonas_calceolata.AAC.6